MVTVFSPHLMLMISVLYTEYDQEIPSFDLSIMDLTDDGEFLVLNKLL